MRYFDSRDEVVHLDHVLASGALPPAFPAVRIDGDPYWDGGIYSNTPIEAVLDDKPRRDSVIFTVHMWNPEGAEPETLWEVMGRQKDIQFASRARSHIARQKQIHHLRHIIRELAKKLPENSRSAEVKELASWGCGTTMHVVRLVAPRLDGEDHTKDIDFTPSGIRARWQAGYADTKRMLERAPWKQPVDPTEGVIIHENSAQLCREACARASTVFRAAPGNSLQRDAEKFEGRVFLCVSAPPCEILIYAGSGTSSPRMVGMSSATVGWMCTIRCTAVYGAFMYMASRMQWMASSPPTPRIAAPRISLVSASTAIFMKPCVSPFSTARETRVIGRMPTSARRPDLRISVSLMPTRPSGGSMKRP